MTDSANKRPQDLTPEQALKMAQEKGIELSENQLDQIAGGDWYGTDDYPACPNCNTNEYVRKPIFYYCWNCDYTF